MTKTGGSSLNGMLASGFERVRGDKGYIYDAYASNERAKQKQKLTPKQIRFANRITRSPHDRKPSWETMNEIGFENCDYVSHEWDWMSWVNTFGDENFHGIPMELHIPCRNPIDMTIISCHSVVTLVFRDN